MVILQDLVRFSQKNGYLARFLLKIIILQDLTKSCILQDFARRMGILQDSYQYRKFDR